MKHVGGLVVASCVICTFAFGANPVGYTVVFEPTGNSHLDSLLKGSSSLEQLHGKLKTGPFALISRAEADRKTLMTVLESQGYDSGSVTITIDGHKLTDPSLPQTLERAPASKKATVKIAVHKGPLYHIGAIETPGLTVPAAKSALGISVGDRAKAAPILAAAGKLQKRLRNDGYAFADVAKPAAYAQPKHHTLRVRYKVTMGPKVNIGRISFSGLKRMNPKFLKRHMALHPGEPYSRTALNKARQSLLGLNVFSSVTAGTAKAPNPPGQVPITVAVEEKKPYAVSIGASYDSSLGVSTDVSWLDRNVFGNAQRLKLSVGITGLGGTGTSQTASYRGHTYTVKPGYDAKATYQVPDFWQVGQTLNASIEGVKRYLPAYSQTGVLAHVSVSHPVTSRLTATLGLGFIAERIKQEGVDRTYDIAQLPLGLHYDTTNSLLNPTHGVRATLTVTPTVPVASGAGVFVKTELVGSTYLDVEGKGRGVLALHGVLGKIIGASQFQVPPDQRFYAGGTGTVRGFTYQTVGPLFPDGVPEGGTAIDALETEFRQRIGKSFGVAPFIDAGQVSANGKPFTGTLRVGAGLGLLYYSGIGPIRVDVGFPVNRPPGGASLAVYIGLGQAF